MHPFIEVPQTPDERVAPLRESRKTGNFLSTCNPFFNSKRVAPPDKRVAPKGLHLLMEATN